MRDYAALQADLLKDLGLPASFDPHYHSDMGVDQACRHALAASFYKKLCPDGNSVAADAAALDKFLSINSSLPEFRQDFVANNEAESCFYDYYKDNLRVALEPHESYGSFSLDSIREGMNVGPGAAQKANSEWMYTKLFESSISYTNPDLIRYFRAALAETGSWCDAEMLRNDELGFVQVQGGKLFFAPKNAEISRTCCTEASLNLMIQKACGDFIEARLEKFFSISLKTQPNLNRRFAYRGSIDGTYGTIDLASASDSIGLQRMLQDLPPSFLKTMMMMSRSETAVLPDGKSVVLRMISTMGNGFTFPLQTLIFSCAVKACYDLMGLPCWSGKSLDFGVFGDDICVRKEVYEFLCKMLVRLGFTVNVSKSFNSGPFRESCGHDYYAGFNIRGVYVRSLETPQHVYSVINRLNRWSVHTGIRLPSVINRLLSWCRFIPVPPSESDDAGVHVPFVMTKPRVDDRYWFKYQAYVRRVRRKAVLEVEQGLKSSRASLGLATCFLAGTVRRRDCVLSSTDDSIWSDEDRWSLSVSLRDGVGVRARYKIVNKTLPYWDFWPDTQMAYDPEWEDWRIPLTRDRQQAWNSLLLCLGSFGI